MRLAGPGVRHRDKNCCFVYRGGAFPQDGVCKPTEFATPAAGRRPVVTKTVVLGAPAPRFPRKPETNQRNLPHRAPGARPTPPTRAILLTPAAVQLPPPRNRPSLGSYGWIDVEAAA